MSCNCHRKGGVAVGRTSPYDQCTMCAKKHVVKAWSLFNEFTYTDDNRDAMTGQLRLAADHLMFDHVETARLARDLAVMLEENRATAGRRCSRRCGMTSTGNTPRQWNGLRG